MTDLSRLTIISSSTPTQDALKDVSTLEALAVYVHWPWCLKKCPYCDFNSHVMAHRPADDYTQALQREIASWRERTGPRQVCSIFFGGGTPSLMGARRIGQVIETIRQQYDLMESVEITVECNPTSSPAALFSELAQVGVNRVSVGVQGLDASVLTFLGREHDVTEAQASLEGALKFIGNVNADVIYGLPDQDLAQWQHQLERMASLGLMHISAYQLTIEPNTHFYSQVRKGDWQPLDEDGQADFTLTTSEILRRHGYDNYEISNFAQPAKACRHNVHVWQYGDYLGIGAGAHGRVRLANGKRVATQVRKDPLAYLERMKGSENAAFSLWHEIDDTEALQEAFIMGLRLRGGLDFNWLQNNFSQTAWQNAINQRELSHMLQQGYLTRQGRRLRASETTWLHVNRLLRDLIR